MIKHVCVIFKSKYSLKKANTKARMWYVSEGRKKRTVLWNFVKKAKCIGENKETGRKEAGRQGGRCGN